MPLLILEEPPAGEGLQPTAKPSGKPALFVVGGAESDENPACRDARAPDDHGHVTKWIHLAVAIAALVPADRERLPAKLVSGDAPDEISRRATKQGGARDGE